MCLLLPNCLPIDRKHRLAIVSFSDEMKATLDSPIIIETIYQSHLVCCVNKDSPLSSTSYPLIESTLDPAVLIQIQFAKSNFGFVIDDICNMRTTNLNMIRTAILSDDNACVLMPQCIIEKLFQADEISQLPIMPQRLIGFGLMYHQEALNKGYFTKAFFKAYNMTPTDFLAEHAPEKADRQMQGTASGKSTDRN